MKDINSNKCGGCNKEISIKRKFCGHSCAAKITNLKRKLNNHFTCSCCKKIINVVGNTKRIFCSHKCQRQYEYEQNIIKWKSGLLAGWRGAMASIAPYVRKYMLEKYNFTCIKCSWNKRHPIDNLPLVEINHIDGNAKNSSESNLEVLCPNCHAETINFRSRNKISSRSRTYNRRNAE